MKKKKDYEKYNFIFTFAANFIKIVEVKDSGG